MPRNLSNGFVFKDERSGHWRAAISWQDEDFLREWRDEEVRKEEEESRGTVSCETPVYRYVLDYIDMKESTGNILASTADGYRWYAKHLLGTELGKTPVGQVTARQIQEFERDMVQDGYGGNTVSHTHVLLKTAFIRARRLGDIPSNPFDLARERRRPVLHRRSPRTHDGDEAGRDMHPQVAGRRPRVAQDPGLARAHEGERHLRDLHAEDQELVQDHPLRRRARTRA